MMKDNNQTNNDTSFPVQNPLLCMELEKNINIALYLSQCVFFTQVSKGQESPGDV